MKKRFLALGLVSSLSIGSFAFAHGGATGIVKERMDNMGVMGEALKALSLMMRKEQPYNIDAVEKAARILQMHSGEELTSLFPEGSNGAPSETKPEVWQQWEEFSALAEQLNLYAKALEAAAPNGLSMSDQMPNATMMGNNSSMMGAPNNSTMMGGTMTMVPTPEHLAKMPVEGLFNMVAQTCASCHSKFRVEKK